MEKYNYPRIDEQRKVHADFTLDAEELLRRIVNEGSSRGIAANLAGKMVRWIIQHIRNHDQAMAQFVKECMNKEQETL